jgi:hypothetical protein
MSGEDRFFERFLSSVTCFKVVFMSAMACFCDTAQPAQALLGRSLNTLQHVLIKQVMQVSIHASVTPFASVWIETSPLA